MMAIAARGQHPFTIRAAVKLINDLFLRSHYSAKADIVLDKKQNVLAINDGDLIITEELWRDGRIQSDTVPVRGQRRSCR